jgi:hypothetical protein
MRGPIFSSNLSRRPKKPVHSAKKRVQCAAQACTLTYGGDLQMSPSAVIRTASAPDPTTGKRWSGGRFPSILVAAVVLFGSGEVAWSDERVGGTEIVINIVEGNLVSGSVVPLAQGDAVYRDEGVRTRVDSKARLLLVDKTNLTVGPSSTIRLDRFVYSGPKQSGTIVLNLAKGTCRLVVGDANKHSYTIVTPTAAIGIRE